MLVLDTNILIAHLGGEEEVVQKFIAWRKDNISLAVSSITECEVLAYPRMRPGEEAQIEKFLNENFLAFPFDGRMARRTARIRREIKIELADAAIAAVALEMKASLVTRNVKDFQKIPGLEIITF